MAGVKGRSGGARPNTGPKPKEPELNGFDDPLEFLRLVWKGEIQANTNQVRAATSALPFIHQKLGEGGKKEQKQKEAENVSGKFSSAAPPKLVAAGGKRI